jgi:hypothetical protein
MPYFNSFRKEDYVFSKDLTKRVTNLSHYTSIFSRIADNISFYTFYNTRPDQRLDSISQDLYDTTDFYWTIPILNTRIINTWGDLQKSTQNLNSFLSRKYPGRAFLIRDDQSIPGKFIENEVIEIDGTEVGTLIAKYPTRGYLQIDTLSNATIPVNTEFTIRGRTSASEIVVLNTVETYLAPIRYIDSNSNSVPFYTNGVTPITIQQEERDKNEERARIKVIRPEHIFDVTKQFEREMNRRRSI